MKIVFFDCQPEEEVIFKKQFGDQQLIFINGSLNKDTVLQSPTDPSILCINHCSSIDKKVFDHFTTISFLITRSTGFDHIDLKEADKRGIIVCYAPRYAQEAVAEHTIALLFSLTRKIPAIHDALIHHHSLSLADSQGIELKGKTLGVIGTGNIGTTVLKLAQCLSMSSIAYDIVHNEALAKTYDFSYVSLDTLLSRSDFISIHAPLTKKTYHMLNKDNIKKIKKGAYLINTARGALIQTEALIYALEHKLLAGIALDVIEDEPFCMTKTANGQCCIELTPANEKLAHNPRALITPHIAYNTKEAIERLMQTTIEMIKAACSGNAINEVPKEYREL